VSQPTQLVHTDTSALLVIDEQARLMGAMPEDARERVLNNTAILLAAADRLGVPCLASEQYPRGLGHTDDSVRDALPAQTPVVEKTRFSCCGVPEYQQRLDDIDRPQIVITGVEAHVCVLQTSFELLAQGRQVFVVEDAVCSRDPRNAANALARLRQGGVIVTNTESVLFEWLGDAAHPDFKAVTALIK
jgi:nicotinamidase-related amidase